jgi:thiol-disulfide isomerase/thioredoxin
MKYFTLLSLLAASMFVLSCTGNAQETQSSATDNTTKVEVIDFYGKHRCVTCKAIEANTKYTLDTYFAKEQKEGSVVFIAVNVDDDKNYKIAEKFEASGTALFLNVIKDGKETPIDLTEFAFMNGNDKEVFSDELKAKIDSELR